MCSEMFEVGDKSCWKSVFEQNETNFFLVVRCCISLVVKRFVNVAKFHPTSVGGTGVGGSNRTIPFKVLY